MHLSALPLQSAPGATLCRLAVVGRYAFWRCAESFLPLQEPRCLSRLTSILPAQLKSGVAIPIMRMLSDSSVGGLRFHLRKDCEFSWNNENPGRHTPSWP